MGSLDVLWLFFFQMPRFAALCSFLGEVWWIVWNFLGTCSKMGNQGNNVVPRRKWQAKYIRTAASLGNRQAEIRLAWYTRYVKGETVAQVLDEIKCSKWDECECALVVKHRTQTFEKVGGQGMAGVLQLFCSLLWCHCIACKTPCNPAKALFKWSDPVQSSLWGCCMIVSQIAI